MKKTYQRLPESELDIMLVLWNGTPPMTRPEIEKVINTNKKLASTTILSLLARLENKNFVEVTKQGKLNLYHIMKIFQKAYHTPVGSVMLPVSHQL